MLFSEPFRQKRVAKGTRKRNVDHAAVMHVPDFRFSETKLTGSAAVWQPVAAEAGRKIDVDGRRLAAKKKQVSSSLFSSGIDLARDCWMPDHVRPAHSSCTSRKQVLFHCQSGPLSCLLRIGSSRSAFSGSVFLTSGYLIRMPFLAKPCA